MRMRMVCDTPSFALIRLDGEKDEWEGNWLMELLQLRLREGERRGVEMG